MVLLSFLPGLAEENRGQSMPAESPNGRFVFRQMDEDELAKLRDGEEAVQAVFDTGSHRRVFLVPAYAGNSFGESIVVVWSKDSTRFAFNYRAGGRYSTTSLFKWEGRTFLEIPSPEEAVSVITTAAKIEELKAMGLKADSYQRRISDAFTTRRWLDGDTIEVDARSASTVLIKGRDGEDIADVIANFRCTVKFDPKTRTWTVLKSRRMKDE